MEKPYDAYVEQQKRKAEVLEAQIRADERERIIALLEQAESACSPWAIALIEGEN